MKSFARRTLIAAVLLSSISAFSWAQTEGTTFHVEDLEPINRSFTYLSSDEIANDITGNSDNNYRNGIIKSSIEGDSLIVFGRNSFLKGMINAYASHRAVELSPDMIWLLICQGFAYHVNKNAEELRDKIVYHEDKMTLSVISGYGLLTQTDSVKWDSIFNVFEHQISSNTKGDLADIITADFSTTGIDEKISSQITLMEATKSYFDYKVIYIGCGIPDVTLLGTPQDWRKVREKALRLKGYGMDWWIDKLDPILQQFIDASEGRIDREFWMEMVGSADFRRRVCGIPVKDTEIKFDGWIVSFYPFDTYGDRIETIKYDQKMLPEVTETPFIYEIQDVRGNIIATFQMVLYAGFLGLSENPENGTLTPRIGWMVRCLMSSDEKEFYYGTVTEEKTYTHRKKQENEEDIIKELIATYSDGHREVIDIPLIVVDGKITSVDTKKITDIIRSDDYSKESMAALIGVEPEQIKNISHLRDAAATAIWGSRGASGVIEIRTKAIKNKKKRRK